jgi:hypothetical protein
MPILIGAASCFEVVSSNPKFLLDLRLAAGKIPFRPLLTARKKPIVKFGSVSAEWTRLFIKTQAILLSVSSKERMS